MYPTISLSQADIAISREIFTCQADFQGNVYNATKPCKIRHDDNQQQIEFSKISVGLQNIKVQINEHRVSTHPTMHIYILTQDSYS